MARGIRGGDIAPCPQHLATALNCAPEHTIFGFVNKFDVISRLRQIERCDVAGDKFWRSDSRRQKCVASDWSQPSRDYFFAYDFCKR